MPDRHSCDWSSLKHSEKCVLTSFGDEMLFQFFLLLCNEWCYNVLQLCIFQIKVIFNVTRSLKESCSWNLARPVLFWPVVLLALYWIFGTKPWFVDALLPSASLYITWIRMRGPLKALLCPALVCIFRVWTDLGCQGRWGCEPGAQTTNREAQEPAAPLASCPIASQHTGHTHVPAALFFHSEIAEVILVYPHQLPFVYQIIDLINSALISLS